MNVLRVLCAAVALIGVSSSNGRGAKDGIEPRPAIVVVTEGKMGLRDGGDFYPLGMSGKEFEQRFGPPESKVAGELRRAPTTELEYVNDGLAVTVREGVVIGITCHLRPSDGFKAADAATDRGVTANSSKRQIAKAYGKPDEESDVAAGDTKYLFMYYRRGGQELSFEFNNGALQRVSIAIPVKDG